MDANLTSLVAAVEADDGSAAESLFAALYAELHGIARRELARSGSFAEIAGIQGVSEHTVQRNWQKARVFLHRTIRDAQLHA